MAKEIIIADSSELILRGLKNIFSDIPGNNIYLAIDTSTLDKYISTITDPTLIIDYTSTGFSLEYIVNIKYQYPKLKILAITPYTNAQTIVQASNSNTKHQLVVKQIQ